MKKHLILISILSTAFIQNLDATPMFPFLAPIRTEIVNQQVIVSNAPTLNKPLATALRKALLSIDRPTPTNLVNDTAALSSIAATLNKTSLSNTFDPLIRTALGNYVGVLGADLHNISNAVVTTFPSGPHTAANNLITSAFDSIEALIANGNTTLATKGLATVAKKLPAIRNLLASAQRAPAPPVQLRATITSGGEGTFAFQPTPSRAAVAAVIGNLLEVIGVQAQRVGATSFRTRTIAIGIPTITNGTRTYTVGEEPGNVSIIYTISQGGLGAPPTGEAFVATSGTLTVTYNSATKAAVGTFTFSGPGQNNPGNTASSNNGVFSVVAQ